MVSGSLPLEGHAYRACGFQSPMGGAQMLHCRPERHGSLKDLDWRSQKGCSDSGSLRLSSQKPHAGFPEPTLGYPGLPRKVLVQPHYGFFSLDRSTLCEAFEGLGSSGANEAINIPVPSFNQRHMRLQSCPSQLLQCYSGPCPPFFYSCIHDVEHLGKRLDPLIGKSYEAARGNS